VNSYLDELFSRKWKKERHSESKKIISLDSFDWNCRKDRNEMLAVIYVFESIEYCKTAEARVW
jgi:hypothetical protein